jgi:hypothetical protein
MLPGRPPHLYLYRLNPIYFFAANYGSKSVTMRAMVFLSSVFVSPCRLLRG